MFIFKGLEYCFNVFLGLMVLAFVFGALSFGDKETMGVKTVGSFL
jgi:hypothetical protein